MRIIISPAKKMNVDCETLEFCNLPVFMEETTKIMEWIKKEADPFDHRSH